MKKIILFFMMCISSSTVLFGQTKTDSIYVGKKFPHAVYYDDTKKYITVEFSSIKYGLLDSLTIVTQPSSIIANSDQGMLYKKKNYLFYRNFEWKVDIKLKKVQNNENIDEQRYKVFSINSLLKSKELAHKLNINNYVDSIEVKDDYIFFRDSKSLPKDYVPNYIKRVYEFKEKQDSNK